ncbi:MAG: hypothetical protein KTR31_04475 [Myxococcales bacterium]|nr:hypothetical protein [Myxococcales bacterium]
MRFPTAVSALLVIPCALGGCPSERPFTRAYTMQSLDEGVGGPKALAQPGDIVMENDRIRIAILGPRPSLGPHTSGGSLVDADLNRSDARYGSGQGNDQLAELFGTVNLNVTRAHLATDAEVMRMPGVQDDPGEVTILSDGSDGGAAIVCVEGPEISFITLLDLLWPLVGAPEFRMRTHYELAPGDAAVKIRTWAVFDETAGCGTELVDMPVPTADTLPIVDYALGGGVAMGDFYLQGGDVDVFAPTIGFDEEGYVFEQQQLGRNSFSDPFAVPFLAGTADAVSYGLMAADGPMFVPMFTSSQTVGVGGGLPRADLGTVPEGTALVYDRWFAVGRGDVGSALDALLEVRGDATGRVQGFVVEESSAEVMSGAHVFVFEPGADRPWSQWLTDVGDDPEPDGSFGGTLPPGDWELLVHATGRPDSPRVPVTVTEGGVVDVVLASPQPGQVEVQVTDETGQLVPAKISFFTVDGTDVRQPVLGDSFIGGSPAEVAFAPYGVGATVLPDGDYFAVASRGLEYEIDVSEPFRVDQRRTTRLDLEVTRSVETLGWISADFHVHAQHSHDSGVELAMRVSTMVSEGVEFFSSADHDHVTNYGPIVEAMNLEPWVQTAVGLETTTIEVGHFLGFPLRWDDLQDSGGALDWTGLTPMEIARDMRGLGVPGGEEPVVFVGHPRDGILGYFDQFGLDPFAGVPGVGGAVGQVSVDPSIGGVLPHPNPLLRAEHYYGGFDALEMLNGKRLELLRTPTQPEMDAFAETGDGTLIYDWLSRTMEEQQALIDGTLSLGFGTHGTLDDWFSLNNLGFRYTLLGNSDTHGLTKTESGCPRNFVMSGTDDPALIDDDAVARAVKEGRVVASYGPFVRFYVESEDQGVGSTLVRDGEVPLTIEVQSPSWFDVDRVELYENGTLIREWAIETPNLDVLNLAETVSVTPERDSWYVVVALGRDDLAPVFTTVEIPPVQLEDIVADALAGVPAASLLLGDPLPIPRAFAVHPMAVTNPIWIDQAGDGFDAPGLPAWFTEPEEPESK